MTARTIKFCAAIGVLCVLPCLAWSQENRLKGFIESGRVTRLAGNVHPRALAQYDQGPAEASRLISPMTLVLRRSAAQQAALEKLLEEQQDPASGQYHRWLTPEQFGERFGFSESDIQAISTWLESQGFTIVDVPASRNVIVFRGTVEAMQTGFRTPIHGYLVDGEAHFANSDEPSLPAALAPLVLAIRGLHDFHPRASGRQRLKPAATPDFTSGDGSHYLTPSDYATIYNLQPLYQAGFTGSGQKIAVVGQCKIALADVQTFRSTFGLPPKDPQLTLATGSSDPGSKGGDCGEAYLDVEWSGGVASGATIEYIYATDALFAVQYAVTKNVAPIVSYSFGDCERNFSQSDATAIQFIAQQANAQGATWLAAAGDSGAAGCDAAFSSTATKASNGLAANFPASVPEVTGVGGTQFNEGSGNYWGPSNNPSGGSAQSYIPEAVWNESGADGLAASGGGLSAIFLKPTWQTGPGVPAQNQRATPDVSLTAAGHDGYLTYSNGSEFIDSGTSTSTPSLAGILAILNQYGVMKGLQSQPGQGNINPALYKLAQNAPSIFHDITTGNNMVPCTVGTRDCTTGTIGYAAGPGYDLATGLGSIDGDNLVTLWSYQTATPPPALTVLDKVTSNTSGIVNSTCSVPPLVTSFLTTSPQVWFFFDVTGAKVGDSAQINFRRPDGALYNAATVPITAVGAVGYSCFSDSITVSGSPAAGYPGTWTIEVFWDQSSSALFTVNFTISAPSQQSLRQIFPHIASDSQWHTDVFVLNTNTTAATFSLVFHTDTGAPMALEGSPLTNNVILAPGGMAFFRTSATTTPNEGWAELDSSAPLSGVAVYGLHGGTSYYEASAPLSAAYSSFAVPFDETASPAGPPFFNAIAITNTDPANFAQINCTAYGSGGNVVGSGQFGPLRPLQHTAFFVDQFGSTLAGQRGTLACRSSAPVAAVELRGIASSPAVSSMPVIPGGAGSAQASSQIFPHIASDSYWHTDMYLLNTNSTSVTFTLTFHTDTGRALALVGNPATSSVTLPPNGMAFFRTSPVTTANEGWAEIDSSAPLAGVAVYGLHGADGNYYEAAAPLSSPYSSFTVPFDETVSPLASPFLDGFAVTNADPSNATQINCTAFGTGGNVLASGLQVGPLRPLQHMGFLIDQQFGSSLHGQRGTLACRSATHVAAVELRAITSSPAVSSLPVFPSSASTPAAANGSQPR